MTSTVTIVGNAVRDPELRYTASGTAVASFGIVYNKRAKNEAGKWEDGDPQFFDVTAWRELAENVAASIEKGTRIIVVGRLEYQTWEKDGDKRSKVQVVAESVGPDLRWAQTQVERVARSDRSVTADQVKAAFDEEPF